MRKKMLCLFVSFFAVLFIISMNSALAQMPKSIKVAIAQPLTGFLALNGKEVKEGAVLAAELINGQGGIKGKTKIKLVDGDTRCNPTNAVNATQRLIN